MLRRNLVVAFALMSFALGCNGASSVDLPDPDLTSEVQIGGDVGAELVSDDVAAPDAVADAQPDTFPDAMDVTPACVPGEGCVGDPCHESKDCLSGWCVDYLGGMVCTDTCVEDCPSGWSCNQVGTDPDTTFICVSDYPNLCAPCAIGADCTSGLGTQSPCVDYGDEGSFCGGACGEDGDCPAGFACLEKAVVSGTTLMQCASVTGTCECTEKSVALGLSTPCSTESEFGTCEGFRVCTEDGLAPCDAGEPVAELCNGLDDDCDGQVDEDTCDDENACTDDVCNGADGCEHVALDGIECPDGDLCTVSDKCEQGICVGTLLDCDDGNVCTDDTCDPATGYCAYSYNTVDCDDDDPCTVADECLNGDCVGVDIDCDCAVDYDCGKLEDGDICNGTLYCDTTMIPHLCKVDVATLIECPTPEGPDAPCLKVACDPVTGACGFGDDNDDSPCDDEDLCTTLDYCEKGECLGGVSTNCNDGNVCTDDSCEPATGCMSTPNTLPCEDGDACTLDDQCEGGECVHGPESSCDDGNVCTEDTCDPAVGCVHTPNAASCDDQNLCTEVGVCVAGACTPGKSVDCNDENVCTDDACEPLSGCVHTLNTAPCNDGDACTNEDICAAGVCGGSSVSCDDGNVCTDDSCDPASGCVHGNNTLACDDLNPCTTGDICAGGSCVSAGSLDCDDANPCTKDICLPDVGCDHEDIAGSCTDGDLCTLNDFCEAGECVPGPMQNCDDGNLCTDDVCDQDGDCVHTNNTVACDDGNACTTGDACSEGSCAHAGLVDCDDADVCTTDSCDPLTGCIYSLNTNPCDDGDACTLGDQCSNGSCQGAGNLVCDDGNVCTDDSCDGDSGCVYTPNSVACDDGNACTTEDSCAAGVCLPGVGLDCDDADVCTTDSCDPATGCVYVNNTGPCTDNDLCTTVDICSNGVCVGSGALSCDDGNLCTNDSCAPATGCVFTNNTASCNDGNPCTVTDQCSGGACIGSGALSCDDGDLCTNDSCNPASGCVNATIFPCCGNDVVEGGEQCDDGNQTAGDGCDASCQSEDGVCSAYPNKAAGAMAACQKVFPNCQDTGYAGVVGWASGHSMGGNCSPPDLWQMFCYANAYDTYNCAECYLGHIQRSHIPCGCNPGSTPTIGYWCQ